MFTLQRPMTSFASKRNVYQNADRWTKVKRCYAAISLGIAIPVSRDSRIPGSRKKVKRCYAIISLI